MNKKSDFDKAFDKMLADMDAEDKGDDDVSPTTQEPRNCFQPAKRDLGTAVRYSPPILPEFHWTGRNVTFCATILIIICLSWSCFATYGTFKGVTDEQMTKKLQARANKYKGDVMKWKRKYGKKWSEITGKDVNKEFPTD